jgi:hypothetical protein
MSFNVINAAASSDRVNSSGAIVPGSGETVISFPSISGPVSIGPSIIASGIITMSAITAASGSGSVSVPGLQATDLIMGTVLTDASGSSDFRWSTSGTTLTFKGLQLSGSNYAYGHYLVYRNV